jgi:hypothetical protein
MSQLTYILLPKESLETDLPLEFKRAFNAFNKAFMLAIAH